MEIQTTELSGLALNWAVAKCEGKLPQSYDDWKPVWPSYESDWRAGGEIMLREGIGFYESNQHGPQEMRWGSMISRIGINRRIMHGSTPLIAAMRAWVNIKLGPIVQVPDELILVNERRASLSA